MHRGCDVVLFISLFTVFAWCTQTNRRFEASIAAPPQPRSPSSESIRSTFKSLFLFKAVHKSIYIRTSHFFNRACISAPSPLRRQNARHGVRAAGGLGSHIMMRLDLPERLFKSEQHVGTHRPRAASPTSVLRCTSAGFILHLPISLLAALPDDLSADYADLSTSLHLSDLATRTLLPTATIHQIILTTCLCLSSSLPSSLYRRTPLKLRPLVHHMNIKYLNFNQICLSKMKSKSSLSSESAAVSMEAFCS